jgi:hypothetical protein
MKNEQVRKVSRNERSATLLAQEKICALDRKVNCVPVPELGLFRRLNDPRAALKKDSTEMR